MIGEISCLIVALLTVVVAIARATDGLQGVVLRVLGVVTSYDKIGILVLVLSVKG